MALSMVKLRSLLCMFVLQAVLNDARASNFCEQVVEPLGYDCTEFTVQTDDGFVLVLHRLSRMNSLVGNGRPSPSDRTIPTAPTMSPARSPVQDDRNVSHHDASGPASSFMIPGGSNNSSSNESSMLAATSNASAHTAPIQAPEMIGNRNVGAQHFNSTNTTIQEVMPPSPSSGPSPEPDTLVSSNRPSGNYPSEQPAVAPGPAPRSNTQYASRSSTNGQRTSGTSSSNYTAKPGAGNGSPVLLMHHEFFNGDTWFQFVDADRHSSSLLPIMLLNDGFDVWIGHQRATYWGHGHVNLKSTDREYWNWTWEQHVQYDLPAQLLFISTETNQPVHFIGASQAATVGAAAAASDQVSVQNIRSLTLIGPTAYRGYTNSLLLEAWAYYFGLTLDSQYYVTGFQNGAFNYSMEFPQTGPFSGQGLTDTAIALISGPNCCLGSAPIQFTNGWDGTTSFKNLLHWQQGIRTNRFARYDYGNAVRNMQAYGQSTPPVYNVAQIPRRLPIFIIGGGRDWTAPPQGIRLLLSQIQQPATFINLTNYAHYDLGFSVNRVTDMYLPILRYLEGPKFQ